MINSAITKGFIYCSVVLFILSMITRPQFAFHSRMVAYTTLTGGLLLTSLPIMISAVSSSQTVTFQYAVEQGLPFLLSMGSVAWLIALHLVHRTNILNNNVSIAYTTYVNLASLLLIFIVWLLENSKNGVLPRKFVYLSILSNSFVFACISILYAVLVFYTTDG
jgi:hypothetical protein